MQAAHDRSERNVEDVGGLLVGQAVDIDELDHTAEVRREFGECVGDRRVELVVLGAAFDLVGLGGRPALLGDVRVGQQLGPTTTVAVALGVAHDRQQPCPRVPAIEGVDGLVGPQQTLLYEVLGVRPVACERQRHTPHHVDLGQDEAVEHLVTRFTFEHARCHSNCHVVRNPIRRVVIPHVGRVAGVGGGCHCP